MNRSRKYNLLKYLLLFSVVIVFSINISAQESFITANLDDITHGPDLPVITSFLIHKEEAVNVKFIIQDKEYLFTLRSISYDEHTYTGVYEIESLDGYGKATFTRHSSQEWSAVKFDDKTIYLTGGTPFDPENPYPNGPDVFWFGVTKRHFEDLDKPTSFRTRFYRIMASSDDKPTLILKVKVIDGTGYLDPKFKSGQERQYEFSKLRIEQIDKIKAKMQYTIKEKGKVITQKQATLLNHASFKPDDLLYFVVNSITQGNCNFVEIEGQDCDFGRCLMSVVEDKSAGTPCERQDPLAFPTPPPPEDIILNSLNNPTVHQQPIPNEGIKPQPIPNNHVPPDVSEEQKPIASANTVASDKLNQDTAKTSDVAQPPPIAQEETKPNEGEGFFSKIVLFFKNLLS